MALVPPIPPPPPTPKPSTTSRTGRGGQTLKHQDARQDTGGSMASAASHSYGRTAGDNRRYRGGRQLNKKRTERRQEEEREMHARANFLETWNSGGGISEGGIGRQSFIRADGG